MSILFQNSKLEVLLNRCKDAIKTHQEKQSELIKHRDDLLQQLNEKQTFIESMMKVNIFFSLSPSFIIILNTLIRIYIHKRTNQGDFFSKYIYR